MWSLGVQDLGITLADFQTSTTFLDLGNVIQEEGRISLPKP